MDLEKKFNEQIEEEAIINKELIKFNWGACILTWIWGIGNKNFLTFIPLIIIAIIPIGIFKIAAIAYAIWIGTQANKWAWESRKWRDINHFREVQKKWAIAAAVVLIIPIIILCFTYISAINTVGYAMKNMTTEVRQEITDLHTCTSGAAYAKNAIKEVKTEEKEQFYSDLEKELFSLNKSQNQLVVESVERDKNHYTLHLRAVKDKNKETVEFNVIKNNNCTFNPANCYVDVPLKNTENSCRLYFDNSRSFARSQKTDKFLKKVQDPKHPLYKITKKLNMQKQFNNAINYI